MNKKEKEFWDVVFDPNEETCFSKGITGTRVTPIERFQKSKHQYFSINPLNYSRRDNHVTVFRTILVENDVLPLNEQLDHIEKIGMPYSTAVSSGNKSIV